MPKNQQKNGFYFFMLEKRDQHAKRGIKMSMEAIAKSAGPEWTQLSLFEKEKYNQQAKNAKHHDKITLEGKLTSDRKPIVQVEAEKQEKEQQVIQMKRNVRDLVSDFGSTKDIEDANFMIIAFNTLCRTDDHVCIPNELGIVKFSLREGIKDKFHRFIHPGSIPFGYTSDAKEFSERTHQIPIYANDFDEFDENYTGIYEDIKQFTEIGRGETILVFCMADDLEQNSSCLEWLHHKARIRGNLQFIFADITYLLMELAVAVDQPYSSESLAQNVLNQHSFDYCGNTRCNFHDELDNAYCAVAYPQRLSYILADALCPLYGITVTEKHLPLRLTKNIMIETWQPKGPIKPVTNIVNVPAKPVVEHPMTTLTHNAYSIFVDNDDSVIVPSMMNQPPAEHRKEPKEKLPDLDDNEEFPILGQKMKNLHLKSINTDQTTFRQPKSMPDMGFGRGTLWQLNRGRGSAIGSGISAPYLGGSGTSELGGIGIGRGIRKKP